MPFTAYVYYEGDPSVSCLARFIDIVRYSLKDFGGRFLVQGGSARTLHGGPGLPYKLLIEFPHRSAAMEWYASALMTLMLEKATVFPDGTMTVMDGIGA